MLPSSFDYSLSCKMIVKAVTCTIFLINFSLIICKLCKEFQEVQHELYPLRHCQRSNKTIIAVYKAKSLRSCSEFAREKRGLAFNFSPGDHRMINLYQKGNESTGVFDKFYNCEVLECPEYRNFSSMANDTRFDYYSLYTHPPRESKINSR